MANPKPVKGEVIEGEARIISASPAPVPAPLAIRDGGELHPALASADDDTKRLLLQSFSAAQVDFLLQRTPAHEIKKRSERGKTFSYVEHGYVTERLNLVFGFNWDFSVKDKIITDDEVIVEAVLTVRTPGGQVIQKTQFGGATVQRYRDGANSGKVISLADNLKSAGSDALKKCASLLGIGLDLYRDDPPEDGDNGQTPNDQRAPMHVQTLKGRHGTPVPPPTPPIRPSQPAPAQQSPEHQRAELTEKVIAHLERIYPQDVRSARKLRATVLNGGQIKDLTLGALQDFAGQLARIKDAAAADRIVESAHQAEGGGTA